jgi:hypothetical protein
MGGDRAGAHRRHRFKFSNLDPVGIAHDIPA